VSAHVLVIDHLHSDFPLLVSLTAVSLCYCSIKLHAFSSVLELKLRRGFLFSRSFSCCHAHKWWKWRLQSKGKWGPKPHL